ncbi:YifB family Mg chelatase-like AAA ATPase [Actinobaculum suis]|uniref:YifB family Mg chelatase-like AAA ATPase n=1 Tax=Actinobaculum suis TaxID=1657 RepID=UPI0008087D14|nr:YifB family Mg chelatase-like AAA ATPase [Actinobaculum suis]OCA95653.1 magnesium chelatase [Actinobaculum suis]OCA95854.1 magnesium chelatase [Actinobaculum suis]
MRVKVAHAVAINGVAGAIVRVEAASLAGIPSFTVVGLGDTAVSESRERIKAAFAATGLGFPRTRITVNLSPADLPKVGTGFDVAIAGAIMAAASGRELPANAVFIGELGLDGSVRQVHGVLPAALEAARQGFRTAFVPHGCGQEAALAGLAVHELWHFSQIARLLEVDALPVPPAPAMETKTTAAESVPDMQDVLGQEEARRAVEIAAAGGHHALLTGAPGIGKSMLAQRLPGILPPLSRAAAVEVGAIASVLGEFSGTLSHTPPFAAPHHTATAAALVGGGNRPRPGAASRAHHGLLFLDELPEFRGNALQALRQPMETGEVQVFRARGALRFPALFQLIGAANPCRCGKYIDSPAQCSCPVRERIRYWNRVGGPILDRFDINIVMRRPSRAALAMASAEASAPIAQRVAQARARQERRYRNCAWATNARAPGSWIRQHTHLPDTVQNQFEQLLTRGEMSMRALDKIMRVAWSIADLAGRKHPELDDFAESYAMRRHGITAS